MFLRVGDLPYVVLNGQIWGFDILFNILSIHILKIMLVKTCSESPESNPKPGPKSKGDMTQEEAQPYPDHHIGHQTPSTIS